jgi:hypothetical protein
MSAAPSNSTKTIVATSMTIATSDFAEPAEPVRSLSDSDSGAVPIIS